MCGTATAITASCGFFLQEGIVSQRRLTHFCFSCRTLGMDIETWLYRRLGRPQLHVAGPVLTDVAREGGEIDWIALHSGEDTPLAAPRQIGTALVRGGCDLQAVADYLRLRSHHLVGEFNFARFGLEIRRDHSLFLRRAVEGLPGNIAPILHRLGYRDEDFTSALTTLDPGALCLLSFWTDAAFPLYRHRASGALVPFAPPGLGHVNVLEWPRDQVLATLDNDEAREAFAFLQAGFVHQGLIGEADFKANLHAAIAAAPEDARLVINLADEVPWPAVPFFAQRHAALNRWTRDVAQDAPNVTLLSIRSCIQDAGEVTSFNHFDRRVYHRLADRVLALAEAPAAAA